MEITRFAVSRTSYKTGARFDAGDAEVAVLHVVARGTVVGAGSLHAGCAMLIPAGTRLPMFAATNADCLRIEIPAALVAPDGVVVETTARAWAVSLAEELTAREPGWPLVVDGLILVGLGRLERIRMLSAARPPWLDAVTDLARQQQTLAAIAARVSRHPSHVAREFRRHQGVSVGEYARRCRLELAAAALRDGAAIAAVALDAGFCDQSHFTNAFHRVFGITPADYRNRSAAPSTSS